VPIVETNVPTAKAVLAEWSYKSRHDRHTTIIPDGCRDLIIGRHSDNRVRCFVSQLSRSTYSVNLRAGVHMVGLRMKPGIRIDEHALLRWMSHNNPQNLLETGRLDEFCEEPLSATDALACLRSDVSSVAEAARRLGISSRTLQRTVRQLTGETPHYWLALARVRRTCRSLHHFECMADAAATFGFADQSHMTREVRRWFAATPTAIKPGTRLFAQLNESGYG